MSRISQRFTELKRKGRKALITYMVAGDPDRALTVDLMHAMVEAGASILELGVPFSDPEAEGPVIQLAHERARESGTTLTDTIDMVREFRTTDDTTPIILMGYVNPIEVMGYEKFARVASDAGVDGTILVNLPPEEAGVAGRILEAHHIDTVYLLAPTTSMSRAQYLCDQSRGFVYYISLKGVTGASTLNVDEVREKIGAFRDLCKLPLVAGFGIKDGASAAAVASVADGAVVGSALVNIVGQHLDHREAILENVSGLVREMRQAIDANATG